MTDGPSLAALTHAWRILIAQPGVPGEDGDGHAEEDALQPRPVLAGATPRPGQRDRVGVTAEAQRVHEVSEPT